MKEEFKNEGSVRMLLVPAALLDLVRIVIGVPHTDPVTGEINLEARLIQRHVRRTRH